MIQKLLYILSKTKLLSSMREYIFGAQVCTILAYMRDEVGGHKWQISHFPTHIGALKIISLKWSNTISAYMRAEVDAKWAISAFHLTYLGFLSPAHFPKNYCIKLTALFYFFQ